MVWLRSQKPAYPRERDYGFTPTHEGGDFESMVQAFTTGYGVFGAKPLHSDRNFAWATDLRASGTLTAVHSVFQSAFEVRTLDETPQHLAFYIPHSGSVRLTVGNRTVEGGRAVFSWPTTTKPAIARFKAISTVQMLFCWIGKS